MSELIITGPSIMPVAKVIPVLHALPKEFQWLNSIGQLPKSLEISLSFHGLLEKRGPDDNPTIINWVKEIGQYDNYKHDSDPWCGVLEAVCDLRAGYPIVRYPLSAKAHAKYGLGVALSQAMLGDTLVFNRGSNPNQGHVAKYIGEDSTGYCVHGGNQSDSVSFTWIAKDRLFAVRRSPWRLGQPASVKKYFLKRTGALSQNEA